MSEWDDLQDYRRVDIEVGERLVSFVFRTVHEDGMGLSDQDSYASNLWLSGRSVVGYADEDWYTGYVAAGKHSENIILHGFDIPPDWNKSGHHMEIRITEYDLDKKEINHEIKEPLLLNHGFTVNYKTRNV